MSTDSNDSVAAEFQRHMDMWGEEDSAAHDALEVSYAALEVKNAALEVKNAALAQENVELRWKASELEQKWKVSELEWKISELRQENADLECGVAHLQEQVRWLEESKLALEHKVGDIVHIPYGKYTYADTTQGIFKYSDYGVAGDPGESDVNKVLGMDPAQQVGGIAFTSGYFLWSLLGTQGPWIQGVAVDQTLWGASEPGIPLQMQASPITRGSAPLLDATKNVWSEVDGKHTFRAGAKASLDKITEVGVTVGPLVKGGVTSSGAAAAGVLARFQLKGSPGSVMAFEPSVVIKSDISSFIGSSVDKLTIGLVDQNGAPVTDIQDEHWSAIMVVEYDLP